jgi:hypothetical protein
MVRRRPLLAACALVLLLAAGPAVADDDDDGGSGGGGSAGAAGGTGAGTAGGDGASADRYRGGAQGTGNFGRDLRGFLGSFVPGAAPPPPAAPARRTPPPQNRPATAVANEIVAIGVDAAPRARLLAAGFAVLEEAPAVFLPGAILRLGPPRGLSASAARDLARNLAPAARFDLNHLYRPGADAAAAPVAGPAGGCAAARVGVVDTAVDPDHPSLTGRAIERLTRRGAGRAPSGTAHGTAIAALLLGALGPARIVMVDAFHRRPDGDAADAFDLAGALALLAEREVAVVNLSFSGPANEVVALATERAAARGMLLAAAAGNDGPQSSPRYPAAHPWVIAVTAVDTAGRSFVRAVRGNHLAFAAPGVGLPAPGRGAPLSGTSYAVPFVTAAFAQAMARLDRDAAVLHLARTALDLGPPGRDPVFGWGLIPSARSCADRS